MKSVSYSKTNDIIQSLKSGKSYGNISVEDGVSKSTVYNINRKNRIIKSINERQDKVNVGGRPRKLSKRDERIILHIIRSGECETAVEVSKYLSNYHKKNISNSKIRRFLRKSETRSSKKVKKPFLSSKHRKERFEFSKKNTKTGQ